MPFALQSACLAIYAKNARMRTERRCNQRNQMNCLKKILCGQIYIVFFMTFFRINLSSGKRENMILETTFYEKIKSAVYDIYSIQAVIVLR